MHKNAVLTIGLTDQSDYSICHLLVRLLIHTVDKYGSKHTGSQKKIQENIGGTYKRIRTDGVYIQEVTVGVYIRERKDMRRKRYEDYTFE